MSTGDHDGSRRRGRPSLPPEDRKSANLKFRTRPALRERIEAAAAQSGRTASEEVEYRLENSFREPEIIAKTGASALKQLQSSWFGSDAMFDNAIVYSKLLHRFLHGLNEDTPIEVWKKQFARARDVLASASEDLIVHLFISREQQNEHDKSFEPGDKDGTWGRTSVRDMFIGIRAANQQAKVMSHLMQGELTSEEIEWYVEKQEDTDDGDEPKKTNY